MKRLLSIIILSVLLPLAVRAWALSTDGFSAQVVPDSIFSKMQGRSYKAGCPVSRADLRYLKVRHYDALGREHAGELICHKDIANDLLDIFRQLHKARYPIERMHLIDRYEASDERSMRANNSSAFNHRCIAGSRKLSKHSYGRAIDINPFYNPCVSAGGKRVQPATARNYANRSRTFAYKISRNDLCCRLFREHGFVWGGDWRSLKDYQHFEKP